MRQHAPFLVAADRRPSALSGRQRSDWAVVARTLDGMQKEAIVGCTAPDAPTWRLVSDEGAYLNGTDLAPFPLAFVAVGIQCCVATRLLAATRAAGIDVARFEGSVDTRYSMSGSALRGDMRAGAEPADLQLRLVAPGSSGAIRPLLEQAVRTSPACAALRVPLTAMFSLVGNGLDVPLSGLLAAPGRARDPGGEFDGVAPEHAVPDTVIRKVAEAAPAPGLPGGAGSSLAPDQRRTLHVRALARPVPGRELLVSTVNLLQPIGSTFEFVCDPTGLAAPAPLAYLSAGLAFCFLTQIGRYATITRQQPHDVRLVQRMRFDESSSVDDAAAASPPETHVFLDGPEPPDVLQRTVQMAAQTCFVHAALAGAYPPRMVLEPA